MMLALADRLFSMSFQLETGNTTRNIGLSDLVIRSFLFLVVILIFFFACGYAWRTIPALKAILPRPKPPEEPVQPQSHVIQYEKPLPHTPTTNSVESFEKEQIVPRRAQPAADLIAEAIADGRPGSVIRASSDLDGNQSSLPIILMRREDED